MELTNELLIANHLLATCQENQPEKRWKHFEFMVGIAAGVAIVLFAGLALRLVDN